MTTEENTEFLISRIINLLEDETDDSRRKILKQLFFYYSLRLKYPHSKNKMQLQFELL